jgi:hypothetical protein
LRRFAAFTLLLIASVALSAPAKAQSPGVAEWARDSRVNSKKYAKQQKKLMKKTYKKQRKVLKKNAKAQRKAAKRENRGR